MRKNPVPPEQRYCRTRIFKCVDNGPLEGFGGIMKQERYYGNRFADRDSLVKMIEEYMEDYILTSCKINSRFQRMAYLCGFCVLYR
ncbi:IS3 family transposase [Mediterraneibacter gnavus]|uniref:IS3 family transposase n=1 Tax=Mediterraneibacter gnavus TaxID=33038 RepID=UPI00366FF301